MTPTSFFRAAAFCVFGAGSLCAQGASALRNPDLLGPVDASRDGPVDALATVAEASGFEATSTHAEVVAFVDRVVRRAPSVARATTFGVTSEGREMPLLILSDPPVQSAAEARALAEKEGRAIVFLFGNIHAGEVDGKEALCALARELALGDSSWESSALLQRLVVLIAPIYNCDGNDRFGPIEVTRPGQAGPSRGAGQRHNAMDLDLNRDYIKLEAPETRAMVKLFHEWNPHLTVDCHTTDGSYHRYLITYAGPKVPAGDSRLVDWVRDDVFPSLTRTMQNNYHTDTFFYGDFEGFHEDPPRSHTRWEAFPALARYSTGYIGLRGRVGLLSESYSYASYQDRVRGSHDFCASILRYASAQRDALRAHVASADAYGAGKAGDGHIALRHAAAAAPSKVMVKGYVEAVRDGKNFPTSEPKDYECEVMNRYVSTLSVQRPLAYLLPASAHPALAKVIENLRMHGVRMETLAQDTQLDAEVYTITSVVAATRPFQGHALMDVAAEAHAKKMSAGAGAIIVPLDQPLGALAAYMLEPASEDGLVAWNFFDDFLEVGKEFPVVRVVGGLQGAR